MSGVLGPRAGAPRYVPAHGLPHAPLRDGAGLALARLTGPLARPLFPQQLKRTAERLSARPLSATLRPEAAFAFFGPALTLRVRPGAIVRRLPDRVAAEGRTFAMTERFLDAGDWSAALMPLAEDNVWEEIHQIVAAEGDWRATRAYRKAKKAIDQGEPVRRNGRPLATLDEVVAYFRRTTDLVASVRRRGLLARGEARALAFRKPSHEGARLASQEWSERDVGVAIAADGALVRLGPGRHRWAAACAVGVDEAAVEVRLVHVDWLARVGEAYGLPPHAALLRGIAKLPQHVGKLGT